MFGFFKTKSVPVEKQLETLAGLGLTINLGVTMEDLLAFHTLEQLAADPYVKIVEAMGIAIERPPFTPVCNRLWMCDFERIEDHGAYHDIVERLHVVSEKRLPVANISDHVDIEEGKAWVEFQCGSDAVHWDMKVNNDWMDPEVINRFNDLLRARTGAAICTCAKDYGQSSLFGCFSPEPLAQFNHLGGLQFRDKKIHG